jgi:Tol biopolymer transport system component
LKKGIVILVLSVILLTGCSSGSIFAKPTVTPTATATITPSPTSTVTPTPTNTPTPTPTPNGSGSGKILFSNGKNNSDGKEVANLFTIDIASREEMQLSDNNSPTQYGGLSWSPDGKKIVYSKCKFGTLMLNSQPVPACELYLMNSDGTNIKKLSSYPQYSNNYPVNEIIFEIRPKFIDNSSIIFLSNRKTLANYPNDIWTIFTLNLNTFEISEPFTTDLTITSLSISPDKSKIAFNGNYGNEENSEIYIADLANNGNITQLTNNSYSDKFPSWSPDGQWLAFHSDRDGNIELYIMKADGSETKRITNNPATDQTASWSPDGKWLAFSSDEDGSFEVYIQNIFTGQRIQLTSDKNHSSYAQWAP